MMARLIQNLIVRGLLFLSLGTIGQITYELATGAAHTHLVSLIILSRLLTK